MKSRRKLAVALSAVAVLAWSAGGWSRTPASADPDLAFIDGMIVHHQGAVDGARALQPRATRPEMTRLLAQIVRTQQAEIDQLHAWRRAWFPDAPAPAARHAHHGGVAAPSEGDPEIAFIDMMIPHHRDAIAMSRDLLETPTRPELSRMARDIIRAQEEEIETMERWRREWQ